MFRFSPALVITSLLLSATATLAQTGFTTKPYPAAIDTKLLVGDFNHDGKADLLSYAPFVDNGYIYMNDGGGGFKAPVALPSTVPGLVLTARVADMNGDGIPDIVACTEQSSRSSETYFLAQYLNDGSGNFSVGQTTQIAGCASLVVGDVNLDGHQDVVVAYGTPGTPITNNIATFFGDGTGKVGNPVTVSGLSFDHSATDGDFNCTVVDLTGGNLFLDNQFSLLVSSRCQPNYDNPGNYGTSFLAHGDGTGHFTVSYSGSPNGYNFNSQTFDLNNDGRPDALFLTDTADDYGSFSLGYGINNGSGNVSYTSLVGANKFGGVASADLNGDGFPDIAGLAGNLAIRFNDPPGPDTLYIYNGAKAGSFTQSQSWSIGDAASSPGDLVSADFNGDGKPDLATIIVEGDGSAATAHLYVFTNTMGATAACSAPTAANTNVICAPAKGSTSTSPVTVTAASNVTGFTANRLYLDNVNVYQVASQTVNTSITASSGSHTLVLVSYSSSGKSFTTSTTFTVGTATPPPSGCLPSAAGVSICAPASGSTAASPVTITAGALAKSGNITAIRAYIDSVAVFTTNNPTKSTSQQVSQSVAVAPGSHKLTVVGYESTGGSLTTTEPFTVGGSAPCYPSSAGAQICSPASGATAGSPITFVAGATAGSGYITAVRLYVDSVSKATLSNSTKSKSLAIDTPVPLAAGKHNVTVVGYQSTGGSVSASEAITVN